MREKLRVAGEVGTMLCTTSTGLALRGAVTRRTLDYMAPPRISASYPSVSPSLPLYLHASLINYLMSMHLDRDGTDTLSCAPFEQEFRGDIKVGLW